MNEDIRLKYIELRIAEAVSIKSSREWARLKLEMTDSLGAAKDQMLLADDEVTQVERELKGLCSAYNFDMGQCYE